MAYIMGLEGPRVTPTQRATGELLGALPRPLWRAKMALRKLFVDRIPGGRAAGMSPDQFDPEQLAIGTRVEMEHTNSPTVAREIAMDHLVEDPNYYTRLRQVHLDGLFTPLADHKWAVIAGVLLGGWLAGSSRGRALVSRVRGK